jgi:putative two-component system response regulator
MNMKNSKPKILIVDDDSIARMALEGLLLSEPYDLFFASNGLDGLATATALHPDLILLDVMMPNMDGFDVCRRIRSMPDIAEVPILLITSLDDQSSRISGLQAGADDFVTKPYNRVELFARLQTIPRLIRYRRIAEQQRERRGDSPCCPSLCHCGCLGRALLRPPLSKSNAKVGGIGIYSQPGRLSF